MSNSSLPDNFLAVVGSGVFIDNPHCPTCANSRMQGPTLVCSKFNVRATPMTGQDCPEFYSREPGSDDAEKVWVAGGWHVAGEGRGD